MTKTPHILVISLGGTIALAVKDGRAVSTDGADSLINITTIPETDIRWSVQDFIKKDSIDITLVDLSRLCLLIHSKSTEFDGFIVTSGTDTLEEVSYFLHEAFRSRLNIIVTGAMRPPYSKDFDGNTNFDFAAATCLSHIEERSGVYVAISGCVIRAKDVVKKSSMRLNSFEPIYDDNINLASQTTSTRHYQLLESGFANAPFFDAINIPIIAVSIGSSLDLARLEDADGCVISCPGAFSLPEAIVPQLQGLAAQIPVVLASRCIHNPPVPDSIYPGYLEKQEARGFLIREYVGPSPQQSRLKLVFDILRAGQIEQ